MLAMRTGLRDRRQSTSVLQRSVQVRAGRMQRVRRTFSAGQHEARLLLDDVLVSNWSTHQGPRVQTVRECRYDGTPVLLVGVFGSVARRSTAVGRLFGVRNALFREGISCQEVLFADLFGETSQQDGKVDAATAATRRPSRAVERIRPRQNGGSGNAARALVGDGGSTRPTSQRSRTSTSQERHSRRQSSRESRTVDARSQRPRRRARFGSAALSDLQLLEVSNAPIAAA